MSSGQDRPTGRQAGTANTGTGEPRTPGAHSAGYQEEYQQSGEYAGTQGRGATGEGYPSETVDYGPGSTGQGYPSERAEYGPGEGRRAGARAYPAGSGRGDVRGEGEHGGGRHLGLAAALLILSGLLTFFAGITGIIKGAFYSNVANYPFYFSVRGRGITELVIGAVVFMVGVCLLLGMHWARWVAVVIATLSAIANFIFLPYYPLWSIVVIAIDIFIIWECAREDPRHRQYA
jgi:hypothetical protein